MAVDQAEAADADQADQVADLEDQVEDMAEVDTAEVAVEDQVDHHHRRGEDADASDQAV